MRSGWGGSGFSSPYRGPKSASGWARSSWSAMRTGNSPPDGKRSNRRGSRSGGSPTEKQLNYLNHLFDDRCHPYDISIYTDMTVEDASAIIEDLLECPRTSEVSALSSLRSELSQGGPAPSSMSRSAVTEEIEAIWRDFADRTEPTRRITSKFESVCGYCSQPVSIGSPIAKVPVVGFWVHEGCCGQRRGSKGVKFKCGRCGFEQRAEPSCEISRCLSCGTANRVRSPERRIAESKEIRFKCGRCGVDQRADKFIEIARCRSCGTSNRLSSS
jgi:hypothetical protein